MRTIAQRLARDHDVVYPGLVETLDGADEAGRQFRDRHVDVLVITEGTYCPDYFVHQTEDWLIFPHELDGLSREEILENKTGLRGLYEEFGV